MPDINISCSNDGLVSSCCANVQQEEDMPVTKLYAWVYSTKYREQVYTQKSEVWHTSITACEYDGMSHIRRLNQPRDTITILQIYEWIVETETPSNIIGTKPL